MKVLFISNDPTIFDATSAARARMRTYAALMGEAHILSPADRNAKEEQDGNLFLYPVHSWRLFRVRTLALRAHVLIAKHGIEVVSAQDPFEHGLAALRAVHGTNAKLHIQVHTDFLSPWFVKVGNLRNIHIAFLNRYRRRIADRVLPAAAGIRSVSERVKTSLIARYKSTIPEPSVIPITVSTEIPGDAELPAHNFNFALIAIGRLEPEKHIEDILKALSLITKRYPMIGLFIVGSGRERGRLERMVRSLNLENRVIFLGERNDARALMGRAQAFIQASVYEGYGRTLIEAALARIPIITTDVGIVGEVFKSGESALVSPPGDIKTLSLNITKCIEDMKIREELPMRAEGAAREHLLQQDSRRGVGVVSFPARVAGDLERLLSS